MRKNFHPAVARLEDRSLLSTLTVTNLTDGAPGSLRAACVAADALPGPDTIIFAPQVRGVIQLTSGPIALNGSNVTINGPGSARLAIDALGRSSIFDVQGVAASINGLAMENGHDGHAGGAIVAEMGAAVSVSNDAFIANQADYGGAIWNKAGSFLSVDSSQFYSNKAEVENGGAILNNGYAVVTNSLFLANTAANCGGAIQDNGFGMFLGGDTFVSNSADHTGGAICHMAGGETVLGSTFLTNHSPLGGAIASTGGVEVVQASVLQTNYAAKGGAIYSTVALGLVADNITFNTATVDGGGVDSAFGQLSVAGGVISKNTPNDIAYF